MADTDQDCNPQLHFLPLLTIINLAANHNNEEGATFNRGFYEEFF